MEEDFVVSVIVFRFRWWYGYVVIERVNFVVFKKVYYNGVVVVSVSVLC